MKNIPFILLSNFFFATSDGQSVSIDSVNFPQHRLIAKVKISVKIVLKLSKVLAFINSQYNNTPVIVNHRKRLIFR